MLQLNGWATSITVGAILIAPLFYALNTLKRMREKWIYPLLRYRERDGSVCSVTMEDPPYVSAHLGESSPPVQLTRHVWSSIR